MKSDRFVQARRITAALGALACTLALSTACTGASNVSGAGNSATETPSAAVAIPPASPGTGSGGMGGAVPASTAPSPAVHTASGNGSGHSAAGPSTCQVRYLDLGTGAGQGTAGSVYVNLVFKNLGTHPCTLYGYPGVSFGRGGPGTGAALTQVGAPADRDPAVPRQLITLAPRGYATATLRISDAGDYAASSCDPAATTYLMVYPPNTTSRLYVPFKSTACAATGVVTLHVQAVRAALPGAAG